MKKRGYIALRSAYWAFATAIFFAFNASAATYAPVPVIDSPLVLLIEYDSNIGAVGGSTNIAEPVVIGNDLYVVDQGAGIISIAGSGGLQTILDGSSLPANVTLAGHAGIINIAGTSNRVYVGFYSSTLPAGFPTPSPLPSDSNYRIDEPRYDLIYVYDRAPNGTLSNPAPVAAFDATTNGHRGGGMLVLPDGRLLYARGDNLHQDYDGLAAPQNTGSTLAKLLVLDPATQGVEVAAMGVRNPQHMTYADATQNTILFSDIGWTVAEEINEIAVADLMDGTVIENFGWGRNADGNAREGGFYVSEGPEGTALGQAPVGEAGFRQPFAQFGRDDYDGWFAVSGPVVSGTSFLDIGMLFGDLVRGKLFATLDSASGTFNDVYNVGLVDTAGQPTDLQSLLGISRIDPRFFNFADGSAGVLSERTGDVFRLTEIAAADLDGDGLADFVDPDPDNIDADGDGLVDGQGGIVPVANLPGGIDLDNDGFVDGEQDYGLDATVNNRGDVAPLGSPNDQIDAADLLILQRFILGLETPTPLDIVLGDMNMNGTLDTADILLLLQSVL
jgi:hypothetical protein